MVFRRLSLVILSLWLVVAVVTGVDVDATRRVNRRAQSAAAAEVGANAEANAQAETGVEAEAEAEADASLPGLKGLGASLTKGLSMASGSAMRNSPADKEGCYACEFTWRRIYASLPRTSTPTPSEVALLFDDLCGMAPPVFENGCAIMKDQKWDMVDDFIKGVNFKLMCEYAQLCWGGLMM